MDIFWKHFSLTTLENRWMWYKRPQKVLEVLEQFLINIVAIIWFFHIGDFGWLCQIYPLNFIFVRSQGESCCHIWRSKESSWNDIWRTQCRDPSSSGKKLLKLTKTTANSQLGCGEWKALYNVYTKEMFLFFHFVPLFQTSSDGNCPKDSKKKKIKLGWMKTWQLKQNINYFILISIRMTVVLRWRSDFLRKKIAILEDPGIILEFTNSGGPEKSEAQNSNTTEIGLVW